MWSVFLINCWSILWFLRYTHGLEELGDIDLGCPQPSYRHGNFCYTFWPINLINEQAQLICQMGGGILAPVKDAETQTFLQKLYIRKALHSYWFGLSDRKIEGQWINADNTTVSSFNKWHYGEPNNGIEGNQHCAVLWMARNLLWDDVSCGMGNLYICEYNAAKCGKQFPSYGHSCYELSKEFATYDEAESICHSKGGMLAVIKTEATFNFLKKLIYAERSWLNMTEEQLISILRYPEIFHIWHHHIWIGVIYLHGKWTYSDGTPVAFSNWEDEERLEWNHGVCVKLTPYVWSDENCGNTHSFICQYPVDADYLSQPISNMGLTSTNAAANSKDFLTSVLAMVLGKIFHTGVLIN